MKTIKNYLQNNLLFLLLITQPFLDILAYFQDGSAFSIAGYIRLAYTILVPLYVLCMTEKKKSFFWIMAGIAAFACLHVANGFRVGYISLFADVKYMLLVLHMPILLISFIYLFDKLQLKDQILRGLRVNCVVITVVFFLTYVLKSGKYTYTYLEEGWTGWYLIPNAQSVIMVSLLPFILYFLMQYCKKWFPIPMLLIVFMYIENGTRTSYYGLVLILAVFFCFMIAEYFIKKDAKLPVYQLVMLILLVGFSIGVYNISPRDAVELDEELARAEEQMELEGELENGEYKQWFDRDMIDRFGEERVVAKYGDDIDSYTFADVRLRKRVYASLVWEDSDFLTKLVGFEYSEMQHNDENFDLENDPPAILYYYGYIGAAAYLALIGYFVLRLLTTLIRKFQESFTLYNFALLMSWGLQLGLAIYTGYLLRRPNVSFYMMAVMLLIYCNTVALRKGKE